jgi:tetratricopeptide (TPR) repeat protein
VIVSGRGAGPGRRPVDAGPVSRWGIAGLSAAAVIAIAIPLAGALALQRSQTAAAAGNLGAAYQDSLTAQRLQPYAAAPRLQEALVLEAAHQYVLAATDARAATIDEPDNWENWLALARIDAERGAYTEGVVALQQAQRLNPRSTLFTNPLPPA